MRYIRTLQAFFYMQRPSLTNNIIAIIIITIIMVIICVLLPAVFVHFYGFGICLIVLS